MIRAIIFDCFGVLYVDSGKAFYEKHIPNYDEVYADIKDLDRQHDYGLISQAEHNKQVAEISGLPVEFVDAHIEGEHKRNKDLLLFIHSLRTNYKVGMLSNIGIEDMDLFFTPEERRVFFDGVVLSGEVGITKPHPYIFQLMAEKLGVTPGECVMIDDIEENCAGADAAGMKAIHYRTNSQVIREVKRLLKQ
jgi:epoxide hydrolase-like predicted phosphatase